MNKSLVVIGGPAGLMTAEVITNSTDLALWMTPSAAWAVLCLNRWMNI